MTQWYYAQSGQQKGPVGFDELRDIARNGGLSQEDLVWNASMKDWLPARTVEGLFAAAPAVAENVVLPAADPSNPYAVTSASLQSPEPVLIGSALDEIPPGSEPIDVSACIKRAFDLTKRNFLIIFLTGLLFFGVSMAVEVPFTLLATALGATASAPVLHNGEYIQPEPSITFVIIQVVHWIISQIVSLFLTLGATRILLNVASGKEATVGQLFSQGDKLLRMIGASILFALAVGVGILLLIVPGIYIALRFGQYGNAIVDRNMGVMEAFRYSSSITTNNRLNLLGLGILSGLIALAGVIALCVGMVVTVPMAWLIAALAYRWMQHGHRAVLDHPGTQIPMLSAEAPRFQ